MVLSRYDMAIGDDDRCQSKLMAVQSRVLIALGWPHRLMALR